MKVISMINLSCGISGLSSKIPVGKFVRKNRKQRDYVWKRRVYVSATIPQRVWTALKPDTKFVNDFVQLYPDLNITMGIIPNSYMVYPEKVPVGAGQVDQTALTQKIYKSLDSSVQTLNFLEPLRSNKEQYIFYRTDHHWTTLGAYYGYSSFCEYKGWQPVFLDSLIETEVADFYGAHILLKPRHIMRFRISLLITIYQ